MNASFELYYFVLLVILFCVVIVFFIRTIKRLKRKQLLAGCRNSTYLLLTLFLLMTASLVGSNLLTYHRLTHESPIASLHIEQIKQQQYRINLILRDTCNKTSYLLSGDEWQVDARIIKWHGLANLLGMDSHYQLDRISGRYHDIEQQRSHFPSVFTLETKQDYDLWAFKKKYQWLPWFDAYYGQSVFLPMKNAQSYQLYMTQSGMIARKIKVSDTDCKDISN